MANFRESLVAQELAVFENRFESVVGRDGRAVNDFDRNEILAVLDEVEAASFAGFGRILLGIFVYVVPLAVAVNGGTLQREFERVTIDLLQERAAHAVTPDVLRPALAGELRGNVLDGVEIDAVALNETHARNGGLPAFAVYFVAEFFADNFEDFLEDGHGVTGIRANHQRSFALENFVAQRAAPEVSHGIENVIRVAHARHKTFGAVFEDVRVSVQFVRFAPRGDGGMLGSGDAVGGADERILRAEIGRIELIEELNGGQRVRAEKIQQMRGAADGGGFLGRDAAESEVVELERKKRGIAGANKGFADDLLDRTRERRNRDGIPDLDEKRFGPVGEPV